MGEKWNIGTFHFTPKKIGKTAMGIEDAAVYEADGKGTEIKMVTPFIRFSVTATSSVDDVEEPVATGVEASAIDSLALTPDPFKKEQSLLSFTVKNRGARNYSIYYRYRAGLFWSDWERINSLPVVLPRAAWEAQVRIEDARGVLEEQSVYRKGIWLLGGATAGGGLLVVLLLINTLRRARIRYNKRRWL
jgi:hypothetical protein